MRESTFLAMENNVKSLILKLLSLLILLIYMVETVNGDAVRPRWSFIKCQIDCMPMCMSINNVKISSCRIACRNGCQQLKGRGVVQATGWKAPRFVPISRP
ncbi:hypothetical protein F3Y22_tig00113124pilonHSYRG00133 [Hibiscus syriacus]|uniref:Plant thionin family protein n=1 Tax=Hibiscus syriacus TaxID=106335 RepID=A0A6A2X6S3_HIBSY|nr:hypothetical protein F3Y22_tig00113124pilonHSYRG00133 [Hibiscus syriacus]